MPKYQNPSDELCEAVGGLLLKQLNLLTEYLGDDSPLYRVFSPAPLSDELMRDESFRGIKRGIGAAILKVRADVDKTRDAALQINFDRFMANTAQRGGITPEVLDEYATVMDIPITSSGPVRNVRSLHPRNAETALRT